MTNTPSPGKLAACPFCGGDTILPRNATNYWFECKACRAEGPDAPTQAEAITAWNRRALATPDGEGREVLAQLVGKHLGPYLAISPTPRHEAVVNGFVTACLAALASRGGGEPVAWLVVDQIGQEVVLSEAGARKVAKARRGTITPLYAASPAPLAPDLGGEAVAPELRDVVQALVLELHCCAQQLAARGLKGHPNDSVSVAVANGRALLASRAAGGEDFSPSQGISRPSAAQDVGT